MRAECTYVTRENEYGDYLTMATLHQEIIHTDAFETWIVKVTITWGFEDVGMF